MPEDFDPLYVDANDPADLLPRVYILDETLSTYIAAPPPDDATLEL